MRLHQIVYFELRTDDPEGVETMLKGILTPDAVIRPYPHNGEVFVRVYNERDETMLRTAASDLIKEETHYFGDELPHDDSTGHIAFKHRPNGPAHRRLSHKGEWIERFKLWDETLRPEDHAEAVSKSLHEDHGAFTAWWAKRYRTLQRKGLV
ncbi:hypothetical protein [Brevundimonas sp. NPDC058933]|uniref:hypothetical protein n=1 Tax=Brevundimonas sp. NPDC058933 TaxID=3346673 RepID=UPI003BEF2F5A